jgi:type II secretory pathway pseudopilin PulG
VGYRLRAQRGDTLIELIVSAALLGILGVGMLTALSGTIIVSNADRGFAGTETVLRSYATALEKVPYKACTAGATTTPPATTPYTATDLAFTPIAGYTTSVTAVKFLGNKTSSDISAANAFSGTCPAGGDQGLQQLTLKAVRSDGTAAQSVNLFKRRGDS